MLHKLVSRAASVTRCTQSHVQSTSRRHYASINKVMMLGGVGADPTTKTYPQGGSVVAFNLAISESYYDKAAGEKVEKTEWFRVACYNANQQQYIQKYVTKGATVYVEGQLKIKKWKDSVGLDHSLTEIQLRNQGQIQVIKRGNPPSESRQREYDQIPLGDHEEDSPREDEDDER